MKRNAHLLIAVGIASALAFVPARQSLAQNETATLDAIFRAWQQRQDRTRSFAFEWEQTERSESGTITQRGELQVDGNRFNYQYTRDDDDIVSMREVFDGHNSQTLSHFARGSPHGLIEAGTDEGSSRNVDLIPMFFAYRAMEPTISGIVAHDCLLSRSRGMIGTRECIIIEQSWNAPIVDEYWLDPGRQYHLMRCVSRIEGKERIREDVEYAYDTNGDWIPTSWRMVWIDEDGSVILSKDYEVLRYSLNEPVASDRFELSFPTGTRIDDLVLDRRFIQSAERSPTVFRYWPLWLLGVFGVICVFAGVWRLARRAKRG